MNLLKQFKNRISNFPKTLKENWKHLTMTIHEINMSTHSLNNMKFKSSLIT